MYGDQHMSHQLEDGNIIFHSDMTVSGMYFIVIFLQNKGEAAQQIKEHVTKIKQKFGKAPTYMRADNGKELINDKIIKFCKEEGITIEATAPYSSSQNGVAEQFN